MESSWILDGIRSVFAVLDSWIYAVMAVFYKLVTYIAQVQIFSVGTINTFYTKIYSILGLFMLFKVSFSFINYIVNPDAFLDKQKGAHKILINVVLVLIMLTITPFCFHQLRIIQSNILSDNVLQNFFLAEQEDSSKEGNYRIVFDARCGDSGRASTREDLMTLLIFRTFYRLEDKTLAAKNNDTSEITYCEAVTSDNMTVSNILVKGAYNQTEKVSDQFLDDDVYTVDYGFGLSTAVGVFGALFLLSMSFDIAVRAVKLGFLEIIAPIPIVSFIDPDSSKNGVFKKWIKQVGTTWASLFIRLFAFYLAIFVIASVDEIVMPANVDSGYEFWIKLFLILGVLMFAKQLPKLIEEIFPGLKLSGSLSLDPRKRFKDDGMLGGGRISKLGVGAIGGTAGLAGGMVAGGMAGNKVGSRLRGALSGSIAGVSSGVKSKKGLAGGFMTGANTAHKAITGKDFNTWGPEKFIMSSKKGEKLIDKDVKPYLSQAKDQKNALERQMSVINKRNIDSGTSLAKKGYDVGKISSNLSGYQSAVQKYDSTFAKLKEMRKNYDDALNRIGNNNGSKADVDLINKYSASDSEFQQLESQSKKELTKMGIKDATDFEDLKAYVDTSAQQDTLGKELKKIDKDIETLNDQKKDIQQGFNVDLSTKQSLDSARNNIKNRG